MAINQANKNKITDKSLSPLPFPHLTGLKLKEDISLNDFVFNRIDEYGVLWVVTNIEGWWNPPSPDMPDIKRGWDDGSYDVKGRYQARQLTFEGSFLTTDPTLVAAARSRLVASINLVRTGAWLKTSENPTKASYVRLSGEPKITTVSARGRTDFSIGLRAADPIKYGWNDLDENGYFSEEVLCKSTTPARTGKVIINNDGNIEVPTILTVRGPIVGPAVIYDATNDQAITITGNLRNTTTKSITSRVLSNSVATLTTSTAHGVVVGDTVTISGVGTGYDGEQVVISAPTSTTFTYEVLAANSAATTVSGTLSYGPDILEIDTYNRDVFLNGNFEGARLKLEVYNDWIKLAPGSNEINFYDNGAANNSAAKLTIQYRPGWLA